MPVYEFWCERCGPFEERRAFAEAAGPARCPHCRSDARRVFSAPNLARTTELQRLMLSRQEQGAEPRLVRRDPDGAPHEHDHAHGHEPHPGHGRPWMLGH